MSNTKNLITHSVDKNIQEKELLTWKQTGEKYRQLRLGLNIDLKQLANKIGCSCKTLRKFESGKKLMWRPVVENNYLNCLRLIMLDRMALLNSAL